MGGKVLGSGSGEAAHGFGRQDCGGSSREFVKRDGLYVHHRRDGAKVTVTVMSGEELAPHGSQCAPLGISYAIAEQTSTGCGTTSTAGATSRVVPASSRADAEPSSTG